MRFEQPWLLVGLAAALVPVVIHLAYRRRARNIRFAAIEFLLHSDKKLARRLRLRQLLVLLLRTLLVAAVVLALAKPFSQADQELAVPATTPTSVVVVVDDSGSMSYQADGHSLLDRALDRARMLIQGLPASHNVAVVAASSPARLVAGELSFDHGAVLRALATIRATNRATDIRGALLVAERLLNDSVLPRRQVVLISDLTKGGWSDTTPPWTTSPPPALEIVDIAEGLALPNVGIVDVDVRRGPRAEGEEPRPLNVRVTVKNDADEPWHDLVTVQVAGRALTGYLEVPARSTGEKVFRLDAQRVGAAYGMASLPGDGLGLDDRRPFSLEHRSVPRVLVLNGAPRSVAHLDETFFLMRALRPAQGGAVGFVPVLMTPHELTAAELEHTDVVILANVGELPAPAEVALVHYVEEGGGLIVTGGDNLSAETAPALAGVYPLPLRGTRRAGTAFSLREGTRIAAPSRAHPVLEPFLNRPEASLFHAVVSRYVLLDGAPRDDTLVVLAYADGAPALVEGRYGAGRVLFLTTTLDRDWTDLPIRTSFLPFVHRMVRYAARPAGHEAALSVQVGDVARIPVQGGIRRIDILGPDGETQHVPWDPVASGHPFVTEPLAGPGVYEISLLPVAEDAPPQRRFALVVPAPSERVLERVPADALRSAFELPGAGFAGEMAAAEERESESRRRPHWPVVLLSLFVLLLMETWLATKG